ncbi:MAG: ABC transporter substrate-binding protein [Firmicutes bacterium]|nr:ABC transporter substrate-binding protein [Bacillota bacterium]
MITSKSTIGEILNSYPELYEIFWDHGFKYDSAAGLLKALGEETMLRTVLNVRGINEELFTRALNGRITDKTQLEDLEYDFYNPNLPVNLLVKTACAVTEIFKETLAETIKKQQELTGVPPNVFIVDGCHAPHDFENFWEKESIDDLPDIIMSMSFDEIYDRRFIDKFISKGYFAGALETPLDNMSADCTDDSYTLVAGLAMVILIDEKNLGDLPRPQKWADLLDPIYRHKIVGFGDEANGIFEYPLYYFYKEFGPESIAQLAHNTKEIYHASKAAKLAGTNSKEAGGIYYLPLTFARLCDNKNTTIVFPEDGALIVPMSFLVKKDKKLELDYLVKLLLNDYGQMCADVNAAAFSPAVNSKLPAGTKLQWLGWDYIKSNDLAAIGKEIKEEFHRVWDRAKASGERDEK